MSCCFGGDRSLLWFLSAGLPSLSKRTDSDHLLRQNPQGAVRAPGQRGLRTHRREDEYPGSARTQALVGGPAETVQCGEKRRRTDTGEGPEWRPVHQFLHHSHPWPPRRSSRIRGRSGNLGQKNRLSPVGHWLRGGPGQCLEISLLVLQKWRR